MTDAPRISILLAVYNGAAHLAETLRSILKQSVSDWEVLVVDNGSSDGTDRIAQDFVAKDPRIQCEVLQERGKNRAYNAAFARSRGSFLCFVAADDLLPPGSLERRWEAARDREMGYSTCLLKTFSENARYHDLVFPRKQDRPNYSGGSLFFGRELGQMIFPIPESLPNEDTWTSLHLRAFGALKHVQETLYDYRIHGGNSYGYGLAFEDKRARFLARMQAYRLFQQRWRGSDNAFLRTYVASFVKGLELAEQRKTIALALSGGVALRDRVTLLVYTSRILYAIRQRLVRVF